MESPFSWVSNGVGIMHTYWDVGLLSPVKVILSKRFNKSFSIDLVCSYVDTMDIVFDKK
jgi:hypothetical protein